MSILKNTLIYKIMSGFFVACRHSKIGRGISGSFKGSICYNILFVENETMTNYTKSSVFFGGPIEVNKFSVDQGDETKEKPKFLSWLYSSFFMTMIMTWKDCEHDDKYS